jgi:hypothetical protein
MAPFPPTQRLSVAITHSTHEPPVEAPAAIGDGELDQAHVDAAIEEYRKVIDGGLRVTLTGRT